MIELTKGGRCCSGLDAINFFEALPDILDENQRTEEFCEQYENALNRIRYEIRKSVAVQPRVRKFKNRKFKDEILCGQCGSCILSETQEFCNKCGRKIDYTQI